MPDLTSASETLLTHRMQARMRPLTDRLNVAMLTMSRGEEYPLRELEGGETPELVHSPRIHQMVGSSLRARAQIYNPLAKITDRPLQARSHPMYLPNPALFGNAFMASRGHTISPIWDSNFFETEHDLATRMAQGKTLFESHVNLEGFSGASQFLREFTGDIWKEHSTADPEKLATRALYLLKRVTGRVVDFFDSEIREDAKLTILRPSHREQARDYLERFLKLQQKEKGEAERLIISASKKPPLSPSPTAIIPNKQYRWPPRPGSYAEKLTPFASEARRRDMLRAEAISRGETLHEYHQNLEGFSGASQFLREFTGDVWKEHSTVDPLKAAQSNSETEERLERARFLDEERDKKKAVARKRNEEFLAEAKKRDEAYIKKQQDAYNATRVRPQQKSNASNYTTTTPSPTTPPSPASHPATTVAIEEAETLGVKLTRGLKNPYVISGTVIAAGAAALFIMSGHHKPRERVTRTTHKEDDPTTHKSHVSLRLHDQPLDMAQLDRGLARAL